MVLHGAADQRSDQLQRVKSTGASSWVDFQDESGNDWQRTSDGLGRLTSVMEPNGTTATPTMPTSYTYDALGNLLTVAQTGYGTDTPRAARNFNYDLLAPGVREQSRKLIRRLPGERIHHGHGLVNNYQDIRKPSFFAYQFVRRLGDTELLTSDPDAWVCRDDKGGVQALFWDSPNPSRPQRDQPGILQEGPSREGGGVRAPAHPGPSTRQIRVARLQGGLSLPTMPTPPTSTWARPGSFQGTRTEAPQGGRRGKF